MDLCKYVDFPAQLPSYVLSDGKLPEYWDNVHFSSPELYIFWSGTLLKHMNLNFLSEVLGA
jgi:hypothetical protein